MDYHSFMSILLFTNYQFELFGRQQENYHLFVFQISIFQNLLNLKNPLKCPAYEYASTQDHEEYN